MSYRSQNSAREITRGRAIFVGNVGVEPGAVSERGGATTGGSWDMVYMGMVVEGTGKERAVGSHRASLDNGLEEQLVLVLQERLQPVEAHLLQYVTFEIQKSRHYEEGNEGLPQVDQPPRGI